MREKERARDAEIAGKSAPQGELVDPIHFFTRLDEAMADDAVLVVVATADGEGNIVANLNDINGDGREDIIFKNGWYERPEKDAMAQPWKVHNDWEFPHACVPMLGPTGFE